MNSATALNYKYFNTRKPSLYYERGIRKSALEAVPPPVFFCSTVNEAKHLMDFGLVACAPQDSETWRTTRLTAIKGRTVHLIPQYASDAMQEAEELAAELVRQGAAAVNIFDAIAAKAGAVEYLRRLNGEGNLSPATLDRALGLHLKAFNPPIPAEGGAVDEWPDLLPLTTSLKGEDYPLDALPETIRNAVDEVQGFVQAPTALVATCALAFVSTVTQAHYDMERADGLRSPISTNSVTIAESGERKTAADRLLGAEIIKDWERRQHEAAKPQIDKFNAALKIWEQKVGGNSDAIRKAVKAGKSTDDFEAELVKLENNKPLPPMVQTLAQTDFTPQSLAFDLARKFPVAEVRSSEAANIFGGHGMNPDNIMKTVGFVNSLWDGADFPVSRRTSESFVVKNARLTLSLQVQEPVLKSFFEKNYSLVRGSGFLARPLLSWPETTMGTRLFQEPPKGWPLLNKFQKRLTELLDQPFPFDEKGVLKPGLLTFSPEAKKMWVHFHDKIERELGPSGELAEVRDIAAKCAENAARLAAQFHVFEGRKGAMVGEDDFEAASRVAAWHLNESRRFFEGIGVHPDDVSAAKLDSWLISYCRKESLKEIPSATVLQYGPSSLRRAEALEITVRILERAGRARWRQEGRKKFIEVRPDLIGAVDL